ncbi:acyl-CoA-binding domain-containing protein 5-like isoform X1 [Hemiscyllium ocellatum]|uniref:acyl-CoA-binding domain-containing protein 5-like isoform X1 n=2 Tax=Hemiscyllium ocellatum TaxID=170820 RepID=UPI0029665D15|nr:acyl-CoA-binding domain-containing protein 5-like isoform X1 [Hemiscyllium ocellatum]XP_060704861.1 acyl-CoA-binding domain-containing protein 5-like isoform X1 [Hemiscyllium ocellatum]XP_060704863.1 acyl-CoA-binding domain-containing protein 5-like isoform X1 [Hemiscyllium ocellatum]XP_060704864.1 acyl-CoA-binding domain-containing protein 5-like isoform X1 [Hemiscyllium ocellatum]
MAEVHSDCQRQFQAAVSVIQALPKNGAYRPSHEKMLKFYSYYKQATVGPCSISRPGFWDPIGRVKWDAWKALGNLSKEEAMMTYVEEIKKTAQEVIDTMSGTENEEQHFHLFHPLYEVVEDMPRPPSFFHKKVSGEDTETPLTSTPCVVMNGVLSNHDSNLVSEDLNDEDKGLVTNKKIVRFQENEVSQNGDNNSEAHQALGICSENGDPHPELGISQLDTVEETMGRLRVQEHPLKLHDITDNAGNNYTGEIADPNHFTSDSESEVFCDSVEELDHERISAIESSVAVAEHSRDLQNLQDVGSTVLLCSANVSTCTPDAYQNTSDNFPPNQETHEWATNGGGGIALVGGNNKKKKITTFTSPLSEWLPEGKGLQQVQTGSSWRLRSSPGSNKEDNERRGHREKNVITVNDNSVRILHHLEEDIQSALQRLNRLEDLTMSQVQTAGLQLPQLKISRHKRVSRWLVGPSGRTWLFLIVWPFIAQWIVHVFLRKRRS